MKGIRAQDESDDVMRKELGEMYAAWVEEWIERLEEDNMVSTNSISVYLIADEPLTSIKKKKHPARVTTQ